MAPHKLLVLSNPVEGREDEYNEWYNNVHLGEMCQLPSVISAQRFELTAGLPGNDSAWKYLAIYEISNDDPSAVLGELGKGPATMNMSSSIDGKGAAGWVFSPVSDVVTG